MQALMKTDMNSVTVRRRVSFAAKILTRLLPGMFAVFFFLSCDNPYMVHNLLRPVYLSGLEVRSDILSDDEPSHAPDQTFDKDRTSYTVTVPSTVDHVSVVPYPEEGAWFTGETARPFTGQETTFTFTVRKEYRIDTVYTVTVKRGLPKAVLHGLELYISDETNAAFQPVDPAFEKKPTPDEEYEDGDYLKAFFNEQQDTYTVRVPAYTSHLAIVARSYTNPENRAYRIRYEFKDFEGRTIGSDGITPFPGYEQNRACNSYASPQAVPSWYVMPDHAELLWGDIQVYPGLLDPPGADPAYPAWFGKDTVDPDPDPRGKGKVASIVMTVESDGVLSPQKYTINLERETAFAYLDKLEVFGINGADVPAPGSNLPEADNGVVDLSKNRIVGNFAKTMLNYEARIPDTANAFRVNPTADWHTAPVTYNYCTYYYKSDGSRWYIDTDTKNDPSGSPPAYPLKIHPEQGLLPDDYNETLAVKLENQPGAVDFYYDTTKPLFQDFVAMEVVIKVSGGGGYNDRTYRVKVSRQKPAAVLHGISVEPFAPPDIPAASREPNVFGPPDNVLFESHVTSYTVKFGAGRTMARITLDNEGLTNPPIPPWGDLKGSSNRIIKLISGGSTFEFRKDGTVWKNYETGETLGIDPFADIELKGRTTLVRVQIEDNPAYSPQEYTLNLLSRNSNAIILPVDADNDGVVRATYAEGSQLGLTAEQALPGDLIKLTVKANLGYYIKQVNCIASTLQMGGTGVQLYSNDDPDPSSLPEQSRSKNRTYYFRMPDENVTFTVDYRPTVQALGDIAYVAAGSRYGGGYQSGGIGTSWGKASNDLQAVINSWTGANFQEIWVLGRDPDGVPQTYTPPDPATYNDPDYIADNFPDSTPSNQADNPFASGDSASDYHVRNYLFSGIAGKEDIAFVLLPGLRIYGGFEETDDEKPLPQAAVNTILSGEFSDGTRAHHVVLAVDSGGATLETLTITGGIGPESDSSITVTRSGQASRQISRQSGGGVYSVNSGLNLKNVIIRNNKSTLGGGMFTRSLGSDARSVLDNVEFYSNTALESGGGMYNTGPSGDCLPRIFNSLFRDNKSVDNGGGLYNSGANCRPYIENTAFRDNSATDGGAIYNFGGSSTFRDVTVENNWTSGNGSGLYNGSESTFFNITVRNNVSKGGSGIGIYNTGTLRMTNASITGNKKNAGSPSGGGLFNSNTAILSNAAITDNDAGNGGGIYNTGNLIMANVMINRNSATGAGGGIVNITSENAAAAALLTNVTIAGNSAGSGGGIYNAYEGSAAYNQLRTGSINMILTNARITGNEGGGIYNSYSYYSGRGINITLNNTTIADNAGYGVSSVKSSPGVGYGQSGYDVDGEADNKKWFPVYIRFRNSVVWENTLGSVSWNWNGFTADPNGHTGISGSTAVPRESYTYSLIRGKTPADLAPSGSPPAAVTALHNLDGGASAAIFAAPIPIVPPRNDGGDYRPASPVSVLVNAGNAGLYPVTFAALVEQCFWKTGGNGGLASYSNLPLYISGSEIEYRGMNYFLGFDNSFNLGDLRPGMTEGPKNKTRPGVPDIGAYEQ
jgi:hypothetical protein